jgi:hypothetical protein
MTVSGKQPPTWATTQSKWGPCLTLASSKAEAHFSVWLSSSCLNVEMHSTVKSARILPDSVLSHMGRASRMPRGSEADPEPMCFSVELRRYLWKKPGFSITQLTNQGFVENLDDRNSET